MPARLGQSSKNRKGLFAADGADDAERKWDIYKVASLTAAELGVAERGSKEVVSLCTPEVCLTAGEGSCSVARASHCRAWLDQWIAVFRKGGYGVCTVTL